MADERERKRKTKPPAWLGWTWLKGMYARRHRWARCFIMEHVTLSIFSTQRAESWHFAIKDFLGGTHKLKMLCEQTVLKRDAVDDVSMVSVLRLRERQAKEAGTHHHLINQAKTLITPYAVDKVGPCLLLLDTSCCVFRTLQTIDAHGDPSSLELNSNL